jgi:hypothetical protein
MATKIKAGRYTVANKAGVFTIKNVAGPASRKWVVLAPNSRPVGSFETLRAAEEWVLRLNVIPASDRSKNYLRDLLKDQAGNPLAERIRAHFNDFRARGELIPQSLVSKAIRELSTPVQKASARSIVIPAQRTELTPAGETAKNEAFAIARGARV